MDQLIQSETICTECGDSISGGLFKLIKHTKECKYDAPNESIESHKYSIEMDRRHKEFDKITSELYSHLSDDERNEFLVLQFNGTMIDRSVILMGSVAINRLNNFINLKQKKYNLPKDK